MNTIIPQRQCTVCKNLYPATADYFRIRNGKTTSQCKVCVAKKIHANYVAKHPPTINTVPDGFKRCTQCNEIKPATLDYFYYCPWKDGLTSACKPCRQATNKACADLHREDRREYNRRYHIENRDKDNERTRKWLIENRETVNERRRILRKTTDEGDRRRASRRKSYANNRDKASAQSRRWRAANTVKFRGYGAKRRAIKRSVIGVYTSEQIQEQLKRQHYRCYYAACGYSKFQRVKGEYVYEIEHTFPLSRVTGTDIPANDMSYLVLACPKCNRKKKNKFPWEWPEGGRLL